MRGRTRTKDYRKLAAAIGLNAILLAGLAGAGHWRHAAKAAAISPPESILASSGRTALESASQKSNVKANVAPTLRSAHAGLKSGATSPRADLKVSAGPGPNAVRPYRPLAPSNQLVANYGKLPLGFEANQGQADPRVKFLSRGRGYALFLTGDEAVLKLESASQKAKVEDRNSKLETRNSKFEARNSKPAARRSSMATVAQADLPTTAKLSDKDPLTPAPLPHRR